MTRRIMLAVPALALLVAGCGSNATDPRQQAQQAAAPTRTAPVSVSSAPTSRDRAPATRAVTRASTGTVTNRVRKVLVYVVENHSLAQMRAGMPWTYRLARRYGYASHYYAMTHPSLPNYLAIAGGSTFGIADDHDPSAHRLRGGTVFGGALGAGRSAKLYADTMPYDCATSNAGRYAVRHNPWTYFPAERTACRRHDVPVASLYSDASAGRLPNVGMVIPNLCDDAHDCVLADADNWLRSSITRVMAGPDFTSGRLAVVVTADEDDRKSGNHILTVVAQRSLSSKVVGVRLNHYGLSRSLSQVGHSSALRHARSARSALAAFGLRLG